ncbi:SIS domain-containing protein [Ferrimicrobium sp.]|uniref:SIS domain-containing protein n=2 Tax=Ferrimicrobium sp. TaxID=2926050 RepID=UPI002618F23F|nr:SIS domain-containing protein [Ferrimicrobium sp.]
MYVDSQGMWEATRMLPEQMEAALSQVASVCDLPNKDHIEHVVVVGMGGSGIAGDVALAAAAPFMAIPITIVKGYELPSYVGPHSLVIAVSFSGNTEETLEVVAHAIDHGAKCVAVTSGGELARLVEERGCCVVGVDGRIPQPRAAFGALSVSVLGILDQVGLFKGATGWINLAITRLKERRDELDTPDSMASAIAAELKGTIPIIVSSGPLGQVAAMRWKAQINENAKAPAFSSVYPEACHNELAGFDAYPELLTRDLSLVILRHNYEHPQIARRYEFAMKTIGPRLAHCIEIEGHGVGELANLFDLTFVGDYVALSLAGQLGIDPGPITILDNVKRFLAGTAVE